VIEILAAIANEAFAIIVMFSKLSHYAAFLASGRFGRASSPQIEQAGRLVEVIIFTRTAGKLKAPG